MLKLCAHRPRTGRGPAPRQGGFSLVEILVTLMIIAFALLGAAGLQVRALRTGQGSQFRTAAVELAGDLAERMEANKYGAWNGNYVVASTSVAVTAADPCYSTLGCTSSSPATTGAALAAADLANWENAIVNPTGNGTPALPNATWSVTQAANTGQNNKVYTITISWVDRRDDAQYATTGVGETFSYTATKTVYPPN